MRLFVDADSCPVLREILNAAQRYDIDVTLVSDGSHEFASEEGVEVLVSDTRKEAADLVIANRVASGDLVVTQDYGAASIALARGARVLSHGGDEFTRETMPVLLARRHEAAKIRRAGGRTRGPREFSPQDRLRFRERLRDVLRQMTRSGKPE
jgi:hypothetical protein